MKKILQLSTYPIVNPLHGGQIRVSQIRKYFEENNCEVKSLSLSEMSHGYYDNKVDYLLDNNELTTLVSIPFCTDFSTALISSKGKAYKFLKENIRLFNPDIILLEQVWLWPAVKKLLNENIISKDVKLVYSSQNIEYKTTKTLLDSHDINGAEVDKIINNIYGLEKDLCEQVDFVIACTSIDADEFISMGAKNTLVCNNGVERRTVNKIISEQLKSDLNGRKYVLLVGSAYPPNALGFWEMLGNSMAWLPPEYHVIAAGGVSKILENYMPESAKLYNYVSTDRIKGVGFVSEELLAALIDEASVILLPITIGGGSNLKTAEAIASGKPVVATTTACRGFEITNELSSFTITDEKNKFIDAILTSLKTKNKHIMSVDEIDLRESVLWKSSLKNLIDIL